MTTGAKSDGTVPALCLSFVGGYVDTFSFVTLFGLFTAHVTGNFVLIGAALAGQGHASVVGKLLALPVFVLGVAATRAWQRANDSAVALVLLQGAGLIAFMAGGLTLGPFADAGGLGAIAVGLVGVIAMAVQNAAARSTFAALSPSTVMTGNVTQVTMDLVDMLRGDRDSDAAPARIARLWPPIVAFGSGAISAGVLAAPLGFWALALPILALAILALRLGDRRTVSA